MNTIQTEAKSVRMAADCMDDIVHVKETHCPDRPSILMDNHMKDITWKGPKDSYLKITLHRNNINNQRHGDMVELCVYCGHPNHWVGLNFPLWIRPRGERGMPNICYDQGNQQGRQQQPQHDQAQANVVLVEIINDLQSKEHRKIN